MCCRRLIQGGTGGLIEVALWGEGVVLVDPLPGAAQERAQWWGG